MGVESATSYLNVGMLRLPFCVLVPRRWDKSTNQRLRFVSIGKVYSGEH